jgi:hypothetical protein
LVGGRGDGTVMATWELRGLGFGNLAETRTRQTQVNEATIRVREIEARVAAEVTMAAKLAAARKDSLANAQEAVRQAEETWVRLEKTTFEMTGRDMRYSPLEALLAEQALDTARTRYLAEVIEFNRAQFRLYWAMGRPPECALPHATTLPVEVPAAPPPRTSWGLPTNRPLPDEGK